ncbi:MAG: anaerobic ribonucleoside-triphosphate reductase activating protein [Thermodesulfobacteriota bacterium]
MKIGGLQKYSLVDYPPLVSCVIFTAGCNFRCPYCHNPALVTPDKASRLLTRDEVTSFIMRRRRFLDGVVISGGEPTIQPDLEELCFEIKSTGLSLKIDTNGSRPDVLVTLIKNDLVDYIAMDVKTSPEHYPLLVADSVRPSVIRDSISIILQSGLSHEFRTTCVRPFTDEPVINSIAHLIRGADLHAIQRPRSQDVLSPGFFADGESRFYSEEELEAFRSIFGCSVKQAVIR